MMHLKEFNLSGFMGLCLSLLPTSYQPPLAMNKRDFFQRAGGSIVLLSLPVVYMLFLCVSHRGLWFSLMCSFSYKLHHGEAGYGPRVMISRLH